MWCYAPPLRRPPTHLPGYKPSSGYVKSVIYSPSPPVLRSPTIYLEYKAFHRIHVSLVIYSPLPSATPVSGPGLQSLPCGGYKLTSPGVQVISFRRIHVSRWYKAEASTPLWSTCPIYLEYKVLPQDPCKSVISIPCPPPTLVTYLEYKAFRRIHVSWWYIPSPLPLTSPIHLPGLQSLLQNTCKWVIYPLSPPTQVIYLVYKAFRRIHVSLWCIPSTPLRPPIHLPGLQSLRQDM